LKRIYYIVLFFIINSFCFAQQSTDTTYFEPTFKPEINYTVKTNYGSLHTGYLKSESEEYVVLENRITHKTVELRKKDIVNIQINRRRDISNEILGENLHAKNYLFLSTAFLFEEGNASTNSHWLLLENIDYAFNEHWALNLNTLAFYPFTLGVKCAYLLSDDNYLGGSVFGVGDVTSGGSSTPIFGYGVQAKFTKGGTNKNVTVAGGLIGLNANLFYTTTNKTFVNMPFVSAAYCNRFSKNVALNLEAWYLPEEAIGLGGLGFKFVGNEYTCWTVGCYTLLNKYENSLKLNTKVIPIPYFGVSRNFN
jgi:hypothetical protein